MRAPAECRRERFSGGVECSYQGGISLVDRTDPDNATEIGFFDRGPFEPFTFLAGFWSSYRYNGKIYGSEIRRSFDVLQLTGTVARHGKGEVPYLNAQVQEPLEEQDEVQLDPPAE